MSTTTLKVITLLRIPNTAVNVTSVNEAIETAALILAGVVEDCEDAANYTEAELEMMERYLAAHLHVGNSGKGQMVEERADLLTRKYKSLGDGLNSTSYGQHLLLIDRYGCLQRRADTVTKRTAKVTWTGTEREYQ